VSAVENSTHRLGRLGHLIVAVAEPHRSTIAEYHRWFEEEHMYDAVLVGPGAFAANRFVATKDLKALRQPLDGGVFADPTIGSFVGLYYLAPDTAEEHFAWSFPQNAWLGATGRNNADRTLVLTWLCDYAAAVVRDGHRVAPHVALDHPYRGMVMAWVEAPEGGSVADLGSWLTTTYLPSLLERDGRIAQVQLWTPRDFPDQQGVPTTPGTVVANRGIDRQVLAVFFLDAEPTAEWPATFAPMADDLAATGRATLRLIAPFIPTVRGTDQYLDQLW
jgi:hypothetical protein